MRRGSPLLALALLLALPGASRALWIADATVATDYIWRGFNNLDGAPALQPWAAWVHEPTGLSATAWFSWGLARRGERAVTDFDETDLVLSWTRRAGAVELTGGLFHLSWYGREGWPDDFSTVYEVFAGAKLVSLPWRPGLEVNYELNEADGNDLYIRLSGGRELMLSGGRALEVTASAGWYSTEWIGARGVSEVNLNLALPVPAGGFRLIPVFTLTYVPLREINPDRFIFWGTLSLRKEVP